MLFCERQITELKPSLIKSFASLVASFLFECKVLLVRNFSLTAMYSVVNLTIKENQHIPLSNNRVNENPFYNRLSLLLIGISYSGILPSSLSRVDGSRGWLSVYIGDANTHTHTE